MAKEFWVYILVSKRNGTLYTGVTYDLAKRVWEHKNRLVEGFTCRYDVDKLVYCERPADAENALTRERERQLKKWRRTWKLRLIEERDPTWTDLFEEMNG